MIGEIGHDGSETLWPDLPDPLCRRGFSIQEIVRFCVSHGFSCSQIDRYDRVASGPKVIPVVYERSLERYINSSAGILLGTMVATGNRHAVTNNYSYLIDPKTGLQLDMSKISPEIYLNILY